uniref:hypothetical protein n=1 Tax=Thaumasiovibrio occultus TaxID=1891184 RepID=UPI000B34EB7C|nr:hypothetical protein [Thaumasiovibrio occultus]
MKLKYPLYALLSLLSVAAHATEDKQLLAENGWELTPRGHATIRDNDSDLMITVNILSQGSTSEWQYAVGVFDTTKPCTDSSRFEPAVVCANNEYYPAFRGCSAYQSKGFYASDELISHFENADSVTIEGETFTLKNFDVAYAQALEVARQRLGNSQVDKHTHLSDTAPVEEKEPLYQRAFDYIN